MAAATNTATLSRFNRIRTSDGAKCLGANWARCYIHASWYDPLEKSLEKDWGWDWIGFFVHFRYRNKHFCIYIYINIIMYTYV